MFTDRELLMDRTVPRTSKEKFNRINNIEFNKMTKSSEKRLYRLSQTYMGSLSQNQSQAENDIKRIKENIDAAKEN